LLNVAWNHLSNLEDQTANPEQERSGLEINTFLPLAPRNMNTGAIK
jgi:hypothetical protein